MYQLAKNYLSHSRDLRCLDYYQNFIVTGGSDNKIIIFRYKNAQLTQLASTDVIQKNVLCIQINRLESSDGLFTVAGYAGGQIVGYDIHCNPIWMIEHNSNISSLCFIDNSHIVSGSWEGKAIVWDIQAKKKLSEFSEHKYAVSVFYNPITNLIISGSQDKALNLWSWKDGKKIKRCQNAHSDIIRQIAPVEQIGFITCSNDQTLKLWSSDLQQIQTLTGHTAFVFSVKSIGFGLYISGGEDRTIRIWKNQECEQIIHLPGSVWQLAFDHQNADIIAGCSDGFLRIFTKNLERRASQQEIQAFEKQVLKNASKKSGMSEEEIKKLPLISNLKAINGKQQGQIRVFRNGMNPQAFIWQGGQWIKIGDVITENTSQGSNSIPASKKYYYGDAYFEAGQYDYIFDVDDESSIPKTIPYNDGGNPLEAAEKYCKREGLSKGYIQQIRKFLIANSSRIPQKGIQKQAGKINVNDFLSTPCMTPIEFNDIRDPSILMKKIRQFNQTTEGQRLNEREINHIERMATQLQSSSNYYNVKFDNFEIDSLNKLLKWPKDLKFPVWDLLRAFLKHYQSETLFSGLSAGHHVISQLCLGLESQNKQTIYTLIMKTLSNILIHNTNKNGMLKYYELVLGAIGSISKSKPELNNKNFLYSISAFMYNYSIAIIEKSLEKENDTIRLYAETVRMRLQLQENQQNATLMLQGIANILSKHHQKFTAEFGWVAKFLSRSNNKDLVDDLNMLISF